MSATTEQVAKLAEPTPRDEVKQRPVFNKDKQKVGELDYVDARFVMDRFDEAVGPGNWQDEYVVLTDGVMGRIGVNIDGQWVWKSDVGTESNIEAEKGAFSDAFKRAAVKWGVGRDLYDARDGQTGRSQRQVQPAQGQSTTQVRAATGRPVSFPVPNEEAPWVCPQHNAVVAWPSGVTAAGRRYEPFYACPEGRNCTHRPPAGLRVLPEHLKAPAQVPDDDLPF